MKNFHLLDICLSDYFAGHSLPVLAVPVYAGQTWKQLFDALEDEINGDERFELTDENEINQALKRLRDDNQHQSGKPVLPDVEETEDEFTDNPYSYWVFGTLKTDYLGFNYIV